MCFAFEVLIEAVSFFNGGGEDIVVGIYHDGTEMKFFPVLCVTIKAKDQRYCQ